MNKRTRQTSRWETRKTSVKGWGGDVYPVTAKDAACGGGRRDGQAFAASGDESSTSKENRAKSGRDPPVANQERSLTADGPAHAAG